MLRAFRHKPAIEISDGTLWQPGCAGLKWIEHEHALDTAMAGMLEAMPDAAELAGADRVLDVGCGTGARRLAAAQRVPGGEAIGIDISKPFVSRAEMKSARARRARRMAHFFRLTPKRTGFREGRSIS